MIGSRRGLRMQLMLALGLSALLIVAVAVAALWAQPRTKRSKSVDV
jgi:hypothetical protein